MRTMDGMLTLTSMRRFPLVASLALSAGSFAPDSVRHQPTLAPTDAISDSLRILYIGRPAGWEH